jgi:hypothetical protein
MKTINSPWTEWWQDDLPCRFSRDDARRNRDFLVDLLGYGWLKRALEPLSKHPLIALWMTNGVHAFLILNALAEDARLLVAVPGFDEVVRDLRKSELCMSSWHVIRMAAMFERAGARVSMFYQQNDKKCPDFLIEYLSSRVNVEAKLLADSDVEFAFRKYAEPLVKRVFAEGMAEEVIHPVVSVVVKSPAVLPSQTEVVNATATLLRDSGQPPKRYRSRDFNIFVDQPPAGKGLYRNCDILCPRSDKENTRVATRIKNASAQLLSERSAGYPGVFCLGITPNQSAVFLRDLLLRRFNEGEYSGISVAYLIQSGTHLLPPRRTVLDYGVGIPNPKSPLSGSIPVKALDLCADLLVVHSIQPGLPAYRVAAVETRAGEGMPELRLADIRRVYQQWLE